MKKDRAGKEAVKLSQEKEEGNHRPRCAYEILKKTRSEILGIRHSVQASRY